MKLLWGIEIDSDLLTWFLISNVSLTDGSTFVFFGG